MGGQRCADGKENADIAAAGPDFLAIYFHTRRLLSDHSLARLGLESSALDLAPSYRVPELDCNGWVASSDPVASVARLESAFYLENVLLRDSDVFGMASALEGGEGSMYLRYSNGAGFGQPVRTMR